MSFFHTKASSRYQRNTIQRIQDGAGIGQEEEEEIGRVFVEYYESLTIQWLPSIRSWQCTEADVPYHSPEARWDAPCVLPEILVNCKSCCHQHYLEFFKFRCLPSEFQSHSYSPNPQVKEPKQVTEFHPISLCNVAYKIASKTIVNRLKKVLPNLVCKKQSAFVSKYLITENVLVAYETMYHISHKRKGKVKGIALKLDMSKAYNRVEWKCLEKIMLKLCFTKRWVALVMKCISTVTYAIRINGFPQGQITPSRGLQQGDLLLPYLFLICAEGLSTMLHQVVQDKRLKGHLSL